MNREHLKTVKTVPEFQTLTRSPGWRNTTHKQLSIKVHYFLHPLYGREVQILKELKFRSEKVFVAPLFDKAVVHLPSWMSDPDYCSSCKTQEQPEASLDALRCLRKFLDSLEF